MTRFPESQRVVMKTPMGEMTMVLTPDAAFMAGARGQQDMPPSQRQNMRSESKQELLSVLKNADNPAYTFNIAGTEGTAQILEVNADGSTFRWYVDPATGRVLKKVSQGRQGEQVTEYTEWKNFSGVNLPVAFTITAGGGSLSARTVLTGASGTASAILTLPSNASEVQVVAATGTLAVTFTATVIVAPALLTDSIIDAVTFNANTSLGPGSILAISGQNLASTNAVASGSLPASLATTRVLLATETGDVPLPLFAVSPAQIVALMPFNVSPGRYMLHCEVDSVRSNDVEISVAAFAPGIFTMSGVGHGPGLFIKDDGSIVTASNPAERGSRVNFYAAGLGAVNPPVDAGEPGASTEPLNRTMQAPRVFFDRYSASVVYSGLALGIAGRYQVTVQVPPFVSSSTNVSVSLTIGGFTSNRVTIPVR